MQILQHMVVKGSLQQFPYSALHKMESSSTVTVYDYLKAAREDLVETPQAKSYFLYCFSFFQTMLIYVAKYRE